MKRLVLAASLVAAAALVLHVGAWFAAAIVIAKDLHPPPLQSAVVLALSALLLRIGEKLSSRRGRIRAAMGALAVFAVAMVVMPLDHQFAGNGFMGDGYDYSQDRDKFERNIPAAGAHQELHFKSHLGDLALAVIDRVNGRTDTSPATAYALLSRIGGALFIGELALMLVMRRGSRRACRYVALALGAPIALTFFGYYEVGYLALSVASFPLLLQAIATRRDNHALDVAGSLQGLHTALHGFGLVGIAGGVFAALSARRRGLSSAFRFAAFALALYLGWIIIYIVGLGISIVSDPYSSHIAFRSFTEMYYFDRRLVHPLLSWNGIAEVGMASLAVGVPLFALGIVRRRQMLERQAALLYALPALVFLIAWWPSAGVQHDMDLLVGAFCAISAATWLASRTPRSAFQAWIVLAIVHVMFWAVVADRSMDRIWLPQ